MASSAKAKRQQRIHDAIDRLASLYSYGALMAETDPAGLLNDAADEIEKARARNRPVEVLDEPPAGEVRK